jgi:hypothetical protein
MANTTVFIDFEDSIVKNVRFSDEDFFSKSTKNDLTTRLKNLDWLKIATSKIYEPSKNQQQRFLSICIAFALLILHAFLQKFSDLYLCCMIFLAIQVFLSYKEVFSLDYKRPIDFGKEGIQISSFVQQENIEGPKFNERVITNMRGEFLRAVKTEINVLTIKVSLSLNETALLIEKVKRELEGKKE